MYWKRKGINCVFSSLRVFSTYLTTDSDRSAQSNVLGMVDKGGKAAADEQGEDKQDLHVEIVGLLLVDVSWIEDSRRVMVLVEIFWVFILTRWDS